MRCFDALVCTGQREIAQIALELTKQALDQNRLEEAESLAAVALTAATKARNVALARQARAASEQIEARRKNKK